MGLQYMFNYSQNKIGAPENAILIRKISKSMSDLGSKVSVNTFKNFTLPLFKNQLINSLRETYINDLDNLYQSLSKVLFIDNFNNLNISKVINSIGYDLIVNEDYIIYNGVLYVSNPLDDKSLNTIKNIKMFNDDDVVFKKLGIISPEQLENINKLVKSKSNLINCKTSVFGMDVILQRILKKAIDNKVNEIKITIVESGLYKVDYKSNVGYLKKMREYVNNGELISFIKYKISNGCNILQNYKDINLKMIEEGVDTHKILLHRNDDDKFGDLISEITGYERLEIIESIKSINFGLVVISSNDMSSENVSYQIIEDIRKTKSIDIMIADSYKKFNIKHSLFTNDYESLKQSTADAFIIRCNNADDLRIAMDCSTRGKLVICSMGSSSIDNTLQKIKDAFHDSLDLSTIQIKSIIHITQLDKVCKNCKTDEYFTNDKKHHLISKASDDLNFKVSKENEKGCDFCVNGYDDKLNVFEIIRSSPTLNRYINGDIKTNDLIVELKGDDWDDVVSIAMGHLRAGETTISSIVNTVGFIK